MNSVIFKDAFERKYTIQNNIITCFFSSTHFSTKASS